MSALSIQPTYPTFTDIDGQPLEDGYIWIGAANLDPQANPIAAYWDAAMTQPATQPIRTRGGYPSNGGAPGRVYVNSDYSIRVDNKNGGNLYAAPTATERFNDAVVTGISAAEVTFTGFNSQVGSVQDLAGNDGADWIGYTPAGTGAVATSVQTKLRETVSVKDFGAVGDGVTDDTAAIQAAIDAAIASNKDLLINGGTYKTTSTLTISSTSIKIFGVGRGDTVIDYFGASSALLFASWGGVVDGLTVYTTNQAANGIEVGLNSRNCTISNIYVQVHGGYSASNTGAGILLSGNGGWSGGLEIRTVYCLAFKYGIKMTGTNIATDTWTTVSMYNCWFVGSTLPTGSAGIYMDQFTNGIGTCLYGGTIEGYDTGILVDDNCYGGVFESDFEGNTTQYSVGNAFSGRIVSAFGVPFRSQSVDGGVAWYKEQCISGEAPITETYYDTAYVKTHNSGPQSNFAWQAYRNASLIDGNPVGTYGLKFRVGIGQSEDYGIAVHPSDHFIQLSDSKLHWGNESPSARAGSQIVAWTQGDVCFNLSATVGQPKGWVCTVAGTPGTWVSMGNL